MFYDLIAIPENVRDQAKSMISHHNEPERQLPHGTIITNISMSFTSATTVAAAARFDRSLLVATTGFAMCMLIAAAGALHLLKDVFQFSDTLRCYLQHNTSFQSINWLSTISNIVVAAM